ncbi:hypothetical protein, partial [Escherichia coli]|uniref:hypothetical protein n=1 Tax=Escherichia coli TaxID=562 RepID=UPI001412A2C5
YQFARDLLAYVNDPLPIANPIFDKILTGSEYTDENGLLQKFEGIKLSIAHYVYGYWKIENITNSTDGAEVLQGVEA